MKADIETRLTDNGAQWIVEGEGFAVTGRDFDELDANLREALIETGRFAEGTKVAVFMGYGFDNIPVWLRQYMPHYFNRRVTIDL